MNRTGRVLMDLGRAAEGSGYGGEHKGDAVLLDSEGRQEYYKIRHDILWEAQYRVNVPATTINMNMVRALYINPTLKVSMDGKD